jgi:large subunit ribosomal protein L4
MMEAKLYNKDGSEVGTVSLNEIVFGAKPNPDLVHQYIVNYLANQRQGTSSTKGRTDVSGGGAKPWRQKGTGRARAGTTRSPIWRGGGITFGPQPRSYYRKFPKKMKRAAIISVFSSKAQDESVRVVEDLILDEIKTKSMAGILDKLGLEKKKCLILDEGINKHLSLSVRNLQNIKYLRAPLANAYDLLNADVLVITKAGLEKIEEVFAS